MNFLASRHVVFTSDGHAAHHQLASFVLVSLSTLLLRLMVAFALMSLFALPILDWIGQLPMATPRARIAHLSAVSLIIYLLIPRAQTHFVCRRISSFSRKQGGDASMNVETLIIGADPAGLTTAYELTKAGRSVAIVERDPVYVGGISRTVNYKGYRFNIGGHRFFSKSAEV
ncbi:MAG: NAD(P)-binding protein [Candidatus Devosia symbiotica]|nr:NAD(P)-binding protein [Candidatus Devosia symbiotica]